MLQHGQVRFGLCERIRSFSSCSELQELVARFCFVYTDSGTTGVIPVGLINNNGAFVTTFALSCHDYLAVCESFMLLFVSDWAVWAQLGLVTV